MRTVTLSAYERAYYPPDSEYGLLVLRAMGDADIIDIANGVEGPGEAFPEVMLLLGSGINPFWVIREAAVTAFKRGLFSKQAIDRLLA